MPKSDSLKEYLDAVGAQIRWKRARQPLLAELEAHITDCRDAMIAEGRSPDEAEQAAIGEMGDPVETGALLDRVHRPRPDWLLIGCFSALLIFGIALFGTLGDPSGSRYMLVCAFLGSAALIAGYFCDYTLLARYPKTAFFGLLFISAAFCFIQPGHLSGVSTTAREIQYALPLVYAAYIYSKRSAYIDDKKAPAKKLASVYAAGALCLISAMFSGTGLSMLFYVSVCCFGVFLFALHRGVFTMSKKAKLLHSFLPAALSLCFAGAIIVFAFPPVAERLNGVFYPYSCPDTYGYLSVVIREYVGGASFIGEGGTTGRIGDLILPAEDRMSFFANEYMLSVAAHKLGWIVFAAAVLLLAAIVVLIVKGTARQTSLIGKLTAFSVSVCFGVRTAVYLATNLGFELVSLDGLPLFSYCGKLAVIDMFMAGLLLSVFRTESITRDSAVLTGRNSAGT